MRLTPEQAQRFVAFSEASIRVGSDEAFRWLVMEHVQPLIPHGMLIAIIGRLAFDHLIVEKTVAIGYPDWALDQVAQTINIRDRPVLQRWLHTRTPVVVCPVVDQAQLSERERMEDQAIGLGRLVVHSVPELTNRMGRTSASRRFRPDWTAANSPICCR